MKIGQVVADRYELEELLGVGGMSSVFRACDRVLDRRVALKVLHEQYSQDPEYVERFRREARAIAKLSHPNIVTVIDRGEFEGSQYIVFEDVRGANLKDLLREGPPLEVGQALMLAHQAARGLAFAHQHGIVHRDVKPQNVLVDEDGVAKVTDFGIARSLGPDEALTLTGTILGTTDYISPEQAVGGEVDERSDQYSLGVLLYELLTGEIPYSGESMVAVAMRHLNDPVPSVRAKRPEVPPRVDELVRRAMAKRPEDRFPSMDALVAALEACLRDEVAPRASDDGTTEIIAPARRAARPRPRRRRRRRVAPFVAALAVITVGAGLLGAIVTERIAVGDEREGKAANVRLRAVRDHDPFGGDGEHPEAVANATDRNPATYWTTETYSSFDKPGVGIVLDAGQAVELSSLDVVSDEPGATAKIQAGKRPNGGFRDVSDAKTLGERTTFDLDTGGEGFRYYVVWITDLDGRAHINEVRAR